MSFSPSSGIVFSLVTAACWAVSPLCFASAGRRVGSVSVTLLRLLLATAALGGTVAVYRLLPGNTFHWPTWTQVGWLALSGIAGMAVGDLLIYEALVRLGPRRTTQLAPVAPATAVVVGAVLGGEPLGLWSAAGVALVLAGVTAAALYRKPDSVTSAGLTPPDPPADASAASIVEALPVNSTDDPPATARPAAVETGRPTPIRRREPGAVTTVGVVFAALGWMLGGLGAVWARKAFHSGPAMDSVAATFVRVGCSAAVLWVLPLVRGELLRTLGKLRVPGAGWRIALGTFFGPFAGMLFYVAAFRDTPAGLVSTLASMSPLFILPLVAIVYRTSIAWQVVAATGAAVVGVAMICAG